MDGAILLFRTPIGKPVPYTAGTDFASQTFAPVLDGAISLSVATDASVRVFAYGGGTALDLFVAPLWVPPGTTGLATIPYIAASIPANAIQRAVFDAAQKDPFTIRFDKNCNVLYFEMFLGTRGGMT